MNNDKKQDLKNKMNELVEEHKGKLKKRFREVEEKKLPRYVDCVELVNLDVEEEPSVEIKEEDVEYTKIEDEPIFHTVDEECFIIREVKEDEVEYIPINEVELDEEEIEELEELTRDLKAIELEEQEMENVFVPCVVNGQEKKLEDGENCNIFKIPLLGLSIISPKNLYIVNCELEPEMENEGEILLMLMYKLESEEDKYLYFVPNVKTLVDAGLIVLVSMYELELDLTPVAFRGITTKVNLEELENVMERRGGEEQC